MHLDLAVLDLDPNAFNCNLAKLACSGARQFRWANGPKRDDDKSPCARSTHY